jgi:hypothetical protein
MRGMLWRSEGERGESEPALLDCMHTPHIRHPVAAALIRHGHGNSQVPLNSSDRSLPSWPQWNTQGETGAYAV